MDLTGKQFGSLTVLHRSEERLSGKVAWLCECNKCGKKKLATSRGLNIGQTKCDCTPNIHTKHDIRGQQFGKLTAREYIGKSTWLCDCDCGNTTKASYNDLMSGKRKTCGKCTTQVKDIMGQKFGKLTVISFAYTKDNRAYWHCICDCDKDKEIKKDVIVSGKELRSGKIRSCGCLHKDAGRDHIHDLTGQVFGMLTVKYLVGSDDNSRAIWHCKCDCGNEIDVTGHKLIAGNNTSCGNHRPERMKTAMFKYAFDNRPNYPQWFIDELYYEEDKQRAMNKTLLTTEYVWFLCEEHGKYKQIVNSHISLSTLTKQHGCPTCGNYIASRGSKSEIEIKEYLQLLTDAEITKPRILDISDGGYSKEIDIFMESKNLGIEYNGSVYHASKGAVYSNKHMKYHQQKFLAAKEQGIHLISIFDVDWNTNADKIKMYLKSLLVDNKKIFARKCEIKSVDRKVANEFTDKYHLQGHARLSSINYGLYYNDELLSVMSFGRLRLQKTEEGQYELHRYCVKDGYTIVGGANRLLKAFEREYNPKYLLSFSDNDYFMGGIYDKLGFTNDGQSTPRYYWFYHNEEIKREKCQLKHLKEKCPELLQEAYDNEASNKEDYVMLKLGACKVYRSGNTRWVKNYVS